MKRFPAFFLLPLAFALLAAEPAANDLAAPKAATGVHPGATPEEGKIASFTARILQQNHYLQQPFDKGVSSKFLDTYLNALDPQHIYFLQSDLREFEKYRDSLDDLTIRKADVSPANIIFLRFFERFEQQVAYVNGLLKSEKFDFNGNERFTPNRRTLPRPANLEEAQKLWRERLRFEYLQEKLNNEKPDEIVKIITRRYARVERSFKDFDNDDVFQTYLSALTHVYDPHSDYMGKSAFDSFNIQMRLSLFGIGALLRSEDGYCKIQELMPGPAMKSKQMKVNDKIIAVAQGTNLPVDVVDMKLNKVVELIRGPKGSEVRLTVIPADATDPSMRKVVSLVRDEIKLEDQESKARVIDLPDAAGKPARLGVIDIPSFYADLESRKADHKSTTSDVARLLKKLKEEKVAGVILDLRRNPGGSLEEAIKLTGLFIKKGPVVQVKNPTGEIEVDEDEDPSVLYDGPLVVLTSRFSASASEIVAGALQDYGRALIVGDSSTHGKGTVQSLIQLGPVLRQYGLNLTNNPGALKLTIRKFYRANGSSTQLEGVKPDVILPSINNYAEVGEGSLENPLVWDTVPTTKFDKVNLIPPVLPELRKRSLERVAADPDYNFVRQEIERFKKAQADKTLSLNEAERRNDFSVEVPKGASLILRHDADAEIKGLDAFSPDIPPVAPVFFAFRAMVGIGVLMLVTFVPSLALWLPDLLMGK